MRFITTTLPYINSNPHIGHALELVHADVLSRFSKTKGFEIHTVFNSGLDEHGLKVYKSAEAKGLSPKEYCDELAEQWKDFYKKFSIKPDIFYRTTSIEHYLKVVEIWKKCLDKGDIYKKEYTGKYCVGCEEFKRDIDLVDGKCSVHNYLELEEVSEENYFFRLTKYKEHLLKWFDENEDFIQPRSKRAETRNFILNIEDISVSRNKESVPWGISCPTDETQNIYVWFEALCNYIIAAGYGESDFKWQTHETIQLCGPDNIRFQAVIFQGILASLDIEHTSKLLVHGTVQDENGKKMSKSLGNVVDPIEQLEKYNEDAVRYYLVAGLPTYSNTPYKEDDLVKIYNSHICNSFGNLAKRVNTLIYKKDVIIIDLPKEAQDSIKIEIENIDLNFERFELQDAFLGLNQFISKINTYLNDTTPWSLTDQKEINYHLTFCYECICAVLKYYKILFPRRAKEIEGYVHLKIFDYVLFEKL
jgi:methionyl-tRNA synthetase